MNDNKKPYLAVISTKEEMFSINIRAKNKKEAFTKAIFHTLKKYPPKNGEWDFSATILRTDKLKL